MDKSLKKILIADDQVDILRSAELLFKSEGYTSVKCQSPKEVIAAVEKQSLDLALIDLNYHTDTTSGQEGLYLLKKITELNPELPIVVMTAWASVDIAVEAMKQGANDFITKPWDVDRLLNIIQTQTQLSQSIRQTKRLQSENELLKQSATADFLTHLPSMQPIIETFEQVANSNVPILITGDNGTGKSRLAQICHQTSARAQQAFITVNMGALSEDVFESEIFGHEKGAFTGAHNQRIGRFELADSGTLFLDEIANISEKQQAALLRLLETGEFERVGSSHTRRADVRIICATNAHLIDAVEQGAFRRDLYYRICALPIKIDNLAKRQADILPLAEHFLQQCKQRYQKPNLVLDKSAQQALLNYGWPGNVRELQHCIERSALLSKNDNINAQHLNLTPSSSLQASKKSPTDSCVFEDMTLADMEFKMLDQALIKHMRKPDEAATALGISRSAFYRKLAKYGFDLS